MFIKSLLSIYKPTLILKNFISLQLSYNKKKMSTLENVIDGLNDVRCRIKVVTQKQKEVIIYLTQLQKEIFYF